MEIVNIDFLGNTSDYQQYTDKDVSLINTSIVSTPFGSPSDYVEYFIYDLNGNLLSANYFEKNYTPVNPDPVTGNYTALEIDPEADAKLNGYDRGSVEITYNFFRNIFRSDFTNRFWIKEISGDRTELRISRQDLSNQELQQTFQDFDNQAQLKAYYPDFYLNFGDNNVLIGVNVLFTIQDGEACLLIKLYEPLPDNLSLKDTFWIVEQLSDSVKYQVTIDITAEQTIELNNLRGPNFNLGLAERVSQTTPLYNFNSLFVTSGSNSSSSLYQQIRSMMDEKGLDINVDYSNFSNFSHFSSVQERIYNFAYKLSLIEKFNADIANLTTNVVGSNAIISGSIYLLQQQINNIIEKFDGYEYYLYYENEPTAWPKSSDFPPYTLYSVTSSQALSWLGNADAGYGMLYSASIYDSDNKDLFLNTIPAYLREDENNLPYETFLNMVGQHFDNIWIYYKDVSERFNAENKLTKGISKDLVGEALKSMGINLYTNTSISDNLYYSTLGIDPDGSLLAPTESVSASYYIAYNPTGPYVYIGYTDPNYYVLDYDLKPTIPGNDITLEYYKRIYHNLPYLLKTRGTTRGLRALINCYGIPDTMLKITEFGGSDKLAATPDLVQDRYSLAYQNTGSMNLAMPWAGQDYYYQSAGSSSIVPDTIEFRFKTTGIPDSAHISQSIFEVNRGGTAKTLFGLQLTYNSASAVASSSLQNNGNLVFRLQSGSLGTTYASTTPITLPFFDSEQWWTVMMRRDTGNFAGSNNATSNTYWVYVKGAAYNEEGNGEITYEASQSITVNGSLSASYNSNWNTVNTSSLANLFCGYLGGPINQTSSLCPLGTTFQGYFQEFRYWNTPLQESAFDEHVQNSISYRGNTITSSLYELSLRIPLGNNLNVPYLTTASLTLNPKDYQYYQLGFSEVDQNAVLTSYHPSITGSFTVPYTSQIVNGIGSFVSASRPISYGLFSSGSTRTFTPFVIADLVSSPSTGVNQKVNNKLFIPQLNDLPETVLSPYISVQRFDPDISKNSADLEVGFSPNDLVDADITDQLGYFNIDDYIGKPSDAYETEYVDLNNLRKTYFQKYISKFTLWDFMNLVKFYDNSLFKMIKDFVPARANLSTGIIIKPHILERPKYPRHEPTWEFSNESSGSIDMVTVTGSNPEAMYLNTSFTQSLVTSLGTITSIKTDLSEPFTGEFSGTTIPVTNNGTFTNTEVSSINYPWTSSISTGLAIFTTYSLGALFNNVTGSRRSTRFLETDYSSNIIIPVNSGLITGALALYPSRSANPTYTGLDSIYWPFSDINDYNYYSYARTNSRYSGSKVVSLTYNTYSSQSATWGGDQSYGNTAAIDHNSYKLGWVSNIPSVSKNFYDKTTVNLKYLVDQDSNVLELSANNTNLFEVQNIFRSGDPVKVSVSNVTVPTNQVALDGLKTIWRGGYSFDPILFRENNEPLSFRFDAPYSSSLTGIGIKAIAENSFGMLAADDSTLVNVDITKAGNSISDLAGVNGRYRRFIDGVGDTVSPFAKPTKFKYTDWAKSYAQYGNKVNNVTDPGQITPRKQGWGYVYELNSIEFFKKTTEPGFNTEPTPNTLNATSTPYIFKAPRSSQYSIDISIPVVFAGQDGKNNKPGAGGYGAIKFFAILEKASSPAGTDWTYLDATELNTLQTSTPVGDYIIQSTYNTIMWEGDNSNTYRILTANLKKSGVVLNQDEVLRLRFFLMDLSNIFKLGYILPTDLGTTSIYLNINGACANGEPAYNYQVSTFMEDKKAYFQLTDDLSIKTTDYYVKKLELTQPLFVTGSADTIRFTANLNEYFLSASTFFPSSSNQDFYTPVVDRFSIQPYDLIRVGPFESLKSKYYTVTKVEPAVTSVTIDTNAFYTASASNLPAHDAYFDNYSTTGRGGATNFAILFVTQSFDINTYFNVGTKFDTTGTTGGTCDVTNVTVLGYAIGNLYTVPSPSYVSYTLAIDKIISTGSFTPATYNILNHGEQITVIPNIDTGSFNLGQTFAILRPKPNETSVILDYKKREGEVSQTMIIPYDASAELKTNVGIIFENLYTQL